MPTNAFSPLSPSRIAALDGLRGWAAMMVVSYHCIWELFGTPFPVLRSLPVSSLLNGSLAVNVFFVLSGFVLTRPGWGQADKTIVYRQIVKRYFRLMPAIVVLSGLVFLVMALGLNLNEEAGAIVGRPHWIGRWLGFAPHLGEAMHYATVGVFLGSVAHDYDPFLWVLPNELWGALVVLGICGLERWIPLRYAALLIGTVLSFFYVPVLFCFLIGADLALLHADGLLPEWPDTIAARLAAIAALLGGAVFLASGPYARYTPLVAAMIVLVSLRAPLVRRGLETGVSQFLGRISFPLYLVQFLVLVVPTSAVIVLADRAGVLNFATALAIAFGSIGASLVAAVAFMPVERLTLAISRGAGRQIGGGGQKLRLPSPAP